MEFRGTKGHWEVKHSETKTAFNVIGTALGGKYKIARVPYSIVEFSKEISEREKSEAKADALLISKAPKMLELLQMEVDSLDLSNLGFYNKYGFNVSELKEKQRKLIKEVTEI